VTEIVKGKFKLFLGADRCFWSSTFFCRNIIWPTFVLSKLLLFDRPYVTRAYNVQLLYWVLYG